MVALVVACHHTEACHAIVSPLQTKLGCTRLFLEVPSRAVLRIVISRTVLS